jgi:peptidoglycan/LPS O-acetylase OafA/YrhL
LRLITAGPASVGLFFTLSGFVLALPWARDRPQSYGEFLVKRFFRLYVPFAAAIVLAAIMCRYADAGPIPSLSGWFNQSWTGPVSIELILAHLFMIGTQASMSLDNVMWSLVHEARISLVFPLLIAATMARPVQVAAAGVALFALVSTPSVFAWVSGQLERPGALWQIATILDTLRYVIYFVVGILLALRLRPIVRTLGTLPAWQRVGLWLLALALLLAHVGVFSDGLWAAGAALLIALSLSSTRAAGVLGLAPLRWLGRVSYSLYLVHLPILLGIIQLGHGRLALGWLLVISCSLALAAAEIFNRLVERPSQRLGQRIGARMQAPRAHP